MVNLLKSQLKYSLALLFLIWQFLSSAATANDFCSADNIACVDAGLHDWHVGAGTQVLGDFDTVAEIILAMNAKEQEYFNDCQENYVGGVVNCSFKVFSLGDPVKTGTPSEPLLITAAGPKSYALVADKTSYFYNVNPIPQITTTSGEYGGFIYANILCPSNYPLVNSTNKQQGESGLINCYNFVEYYLVPNTQPSYDTESLCKKEGNPCNPSTGNKLQQEIDYYSTSNNLTLSRYYNSQNEHFPNNRMSNNWQHSFSASMNSISSLLSLDTKAAGPYTGSELACVNGFEEIKDQVWSGALISGNSVFENDLCNINNALGARVTTFTLERVPKGESLPAIAPPVGQHQVISRSDGSFYVFTSTINGWVDLTNPDIKLNSNGSLWVFTDKNNVKEIFNENGQLIKIIEVSGRETILSYTEPLASGGDNNDSTLDKVIDADGSQLTFHYSDVGGVSRLTSVTTPDGDIQYGYNGSNVTTVTYPDNTQKVYEYADTRFPNHLTAIGDENAQRYASWTYHADGKAATSEHADGQEKVTLSYNSNHSTQVTGALNDNRTYNFKYVRGIRRVTSITGDECRTCGNGFMQTRTYDANGFLNGYTDWQGNQTTIVNNSRGLPVSQTDAVGTDEERTTTTTWHSSLNLPLTITEPKRQTTFAYTTTGQLLTRTVTDPATGDSRTTTYTYHPLSANGGGLIATIDGPRTDVNDVTSYEYNSTDDLISITNALGHVTQITSHDPSGRSLTITDANGTAITLTWDLRGRLTQSTFDNRATDYTYDPVGQLTRVTQADGSYLDYKYDDAHRLYEISDNLGHTITYTLDKMGNRTQTTTSDNSNSITSRQTAVFDKLSRLKQVLGSNGQTQTYNYDDNHNPLNSTDAKSRQSHSKYDALDRLIKSIDPDAKETNLEYDAQDNLTKVTDARGLETTYTYNGFDEVISQTSPDTGTTTYTYDSAGNVASMTDERGITVNYTYDALNRVLTESYPDSTELVRYRYDTGTRRNGRIYDMRDDSGRTIFSYDTRGNNTYSRHDIDDYQFITRYSYWNDNRLRVLTYPSGRQVLYTRDASGRINRVRTRDKVDGEYTAWEYLANNITHQPFGDINSMLFGNGLSYQADFDLDARLTQQTVNSILENNYSYNNVNNLVTIGHALNTALDQYHEYDNLDRLIYEESVNGPRYFEYDAVGNRTYELKNNSSSIYTSQKTTANQIETLNSQINYEYDDIGNTITDRNGTRTMTYNDKGRLETLSKSGVLKGSYKYNAQGQRVKKSRPLTDGRTLHYYFQYDKQGQLLSEVYYIDTRLVSYTDFIWLEGRPITQIRKLFKANGDVNRVETRYLHTDHLNTPRKATDENGTVVWRWDSDAFGYAQPNRDPDGDGTNQYVRLRFAGQYHDAESGLFYNYFRYYDPYTGRYVTSDPIGLGGGINTYGYVGGNPTGAIDPLGLAAGRSCELTGTCTPSRPMTHSDLDTMGLLPVVGIGADAVNAFWHAAEGNFGSAIFAAASMIPVAGDAIAACKIAKRVPDSTIVCRGGTCKPELFTNGNGVTTDAAGNLSGISTGIGDSVASASKNIPHSKVGVTTAGDIRAAGGSVINDRGNHANVSGITANQAAEIFKNVVKNPNK